MFNLFRYLIFIFRMLIFLLINFIPIRRFVKNPKKNDAKNMQRLIKIQHILQKYCRVKMNKIGDEHINPDQTYLIVCNHASIADPFLMLDCINRPFAAVIAGELYFQKIPIFGKWFTAMRCVYINRENPKEAIYGLNETISNLKNEISMLIFPEGEITRMISEDVIGEFKNGAFTVARKSKVPILIFTLIGSEKVYPKYGISGIIRKGKVTRVVLPPYERHLHEKISTREIAEDIQKIMKDTIIKYSRESDV